MSFKRVAVAVSGGVDSAVSAFLLKSKGFDVHAVFMKNWDLADEGADCSRASDLEDAEFVCKKLELPFRQVSFVKEYWSEVFTYMLDEYERGLTPNPDIMCNKKIKFDSFFKLATTEIGADAMATGHYARSSFGCYLERYDMSESSRLLKAVDSTKDQSFFLSQIPQESLRRTMFPLGTMRKKDVKAIAAANGLERIAKKRESMGMCFIGARNFRKFIADYIPPRPGRFVNIDTGRSLGEHTGVHNWAVGQRIPVAGLPRSTYIVKKLDNSDVIVAPGRFHPAALSRMLLTEEPHWISLSAPPDLDTVLDCDVRFFNVQPLSKCRVFRLASGRLCVLLERPVTQMNPGQFAVFYEGDECLGSARIARVGPTYFSLGKAVPEGFEEFRGDVETLDMFRG